MLHSSFVIPRINSEDLCPTATCEFLARLKKNNCLKHITAPVSQDLEITEIADRVMKGAREQNVALIFIPLVIAYQAWTYYIFRQRVSKKVTRVVMRGR